MCHKKDPIKMEGVCLALILLMGYASGQWVWSQGKGPSTGSVSNIPVNNIRIVNGQARLIPGAADIISNSIQTISGGGGGGGGTFGSGLIGSVLQNVPQIASAALGILLGRPPTLPAKDPGDINTGTGGSTGPSSVTITTNKDRCKCVQRNQCFLPNKPGGSCDGGNELCCETSTGTRTIFEDERREREREPTRQVTRDIAHVRRGLLENIIKGGSSLVDDTLDLILAPYLTEEDQIKVAQRVVP